MLAFWGDDEALKARNLIMQIIQFHEKDRGTLIEQLVILI